MQVRIKYLKNIKKLKKINEGDWIDLRVAENIRISDPCGNCFGDRFRLVPLGVAMELPKGYEAHVVPRSSTFKNYGVIQTNSCAVIDNSYCGDNDEWFWPMFIIDPKVRVIPKNTRIAQFRIIKKQPTLEFKEVKSLGNKNRGGHGSTGKD